MKVWRLFILLWLAATLLACALGQPQPASKIVPISELNQIAGTWEGLSKRMPDMRDHAQVVLIIREKGYFNFASNRETGLLLGTGTLYIQDGQVFAVSDHGTGMFTLHDTAGSPLLVVEVGLKDGHYYRVEMTPLKGRSPTVPEK